jgi:cyclase
MTRAALAVASIIVLITLAVAGVQSQRQPAGTAHNGNAYRFNKVADGVYHAIGTGSLTVVGNSTVIVNSDDVILVDDHVSPAAAWVLLDEIKTLTNKPVRTVINTHFHYDHAHGNQIATLKQRIQAETDPAAKATLQGQLQAAENNAASQAELKPTPPNVTIRSNMTLYRGDREIHIRFLGRAHTAGDLALHDCSDPDKGACIL